MKGLIIIASDGTHYELGPDGVLRKVPPPIDPAKDYPMKPPSPRWSLFSEAAKRNLE